MADALGGRGISVVRGYLLDRIPRQWMLYPCAYVWYIQQTHQRENSIYFTYLQLIGFMAGLGNSVMCDAGLFVDAYLLMFLFRCGVRVNRYR